MEITFTDNKSIKDLCNYDCDRIVPIIKGLTLKGATVIYAVAPFLLCLK